MVGVELQLRVCFISLLPTVGASRAVYACFRVANAFIEHAVEIKSGNSWSNKDRDSTIDTRRRKQTGTRGLMNGPCDSAKHIYYNASMSRWDV